MSRETESMDQSSDDDPESGAARSKQRLSPITKTASVSDSASPEGPLDLSDVMGQLQVDKNQEVHYFGKTPSRYIVQSMAHTNHSLFCAQELSPLPRRLSFYRP